MISYSDNYVSIITITYNNFDELVQTINSTRDCKNIESVIINGGSCLKTKKYLDDLVNANSKVKAFSGLDDGIADAFNKGLKIAEGNYILFLNSGDILLDVEYPEKAKVLLQKNPNLSYVHSNIIFDDKLCGEVLMPPRECQVGRGMPYHHQTLIVKKDVFDSIGGFKKKYIINMDYDFIVRMKKKGYQGAFLNNDNTAPVRMDGAGISSLHEWASIKEAFLVLRENESLDFKVLGSYVLRLLLFFARKIMLCLKLSFLLKKMKIRKNKAILKKPKTKNIL